MVEFYLDVFLQIVFQSVYYKPILIQVLLIPIMLMMTSFAIRIMREVSTRETRDKIEVDCESSRQSCIRGRLPKIKIF